MSVHKTDPAWLTNDAIASYAEQVGVKNGIYEPTGRANIDLLLRRLGGQLANAIDEESSHVRERGAFTIFVPQLTSARRDRFTIAHELGHYFLHYLHAKEQGEKSFSRGGRDRAETEANVFASALLMPAEAFKAAHRAYSGDTWKLAAHFDVSPRAAEVRAQVLELL
ncbi:ImmA/IrrE family metallo-endopeptidase [Mycolicibacterium madagascariense]|uniref:ImmA/IrrE family metallo-endopeptidase n=1 Tax=Mycolicibacterium madagascariense TaxID=212765 RepID=UPI0013D62739|nr:ImmA/IrrE family metallo-endopeptidase [Mycolicibacterium madagascariense]MCV7013063.1 ImmA/IrrE family metallo-endopeptidase [Mycolicibacterium madagascariense]